MKGKVIAIEAESRRGAVQTLYGDYTVFELLNGQSVDMGDVLDGFLETLGPETVTNNSKEGALKIVIKATGASREKATQMVENGIYPTVNRRTRRRSEKPKL